MVTIAAAGLLAALALLAAFASRSRPAMLALAGAAAGGAAGLAMGIAAALLRTQATLVLGGVAIGATIWAPVLFGVAGAALGLLAARSGKVHQPRGSP